ncbi:hypothetical protein PGT21_036742 [Puccinia graminis f. sp. tritici]|uniref:Uncharacterized protein n=1 Tax=Puccinia graminis f. sp. tritici TaxID=56615 RepID=A0A5B0Q0D0_PUCGR|nr:hypothetical protein PGT21_036742 [Puccinia graminis f. sp. tritici]KAA1126163.1 hypothetical protein PGTUg99_004621 [Puccinia graminis f. sp. tritici]
MPDKSRIRNMAGLRLSKDLFVNRDPLERSGRPSSGRVRGVFATSVGGSRCASAK